MGKRVNTLIRNPAGLIITLILFTVSCSTPPSPRIPPEASGLNENESLNIYNDYKLSRTGSVFLGTYFYQGNDPRRLNYQKIGVLFDKPAGQAEAAYIKARKVTFAGLLTAGAGGGLVGYPLGGYLASGNFTSADYLLLGTGTGLIVLSYVLSAAADRSFDRAVDEYNLWLEAEY